jgi:hypothetical protein
MNVRIEDFGIVQMIVRRIVLLIVERKTIDRVKRRRTNRRETQEYKKTKVRKISRYQRHSDLRTMKIGNIVMVFHNLLMVQILTRNGIQQEVEVEVEAIIVEIIEGIKKFQERMRPGQEAMGLNLQNFLSTDTPSNPVYIDTILQQLFQDLH